MLQNTYEIGGNVKNCVILSKNALMTKLVTDETRTILVQFNLLSPYFERKMDEIDGIGHSDANLSLLHQFCMVKNLFRR